MNSVTYLVQNERSECRSEGFGRCCTEEITCPDQNTQSGVVAMAIGAPWLDKDRPQPYTRQH